MDDRHRAGTGLFVIDVDNRPGVLAKIAATFHRRGLNIRTLTVAPIDSPGVSRMHIEVTAARPELERVAVAIDNFVDVLSVELREPDALGNPAG